MRHEPASANAAAHPQPLSAPQAWAMLLALVSGFALSQAFSHHHRHHGHGAAGGVYPVGPGAGVFAGTFAFAFGTMQLFMGIAIDFWGHSAHLCWWRFRWRLQGLRCLRWATAGSMLLLGQVLIGVGCAPAFWCARCSSPATLRRRASPPCQAQPWGRWAGMLFTGTPLAWLVEQSSWRWGLGAGGRRRWPGLIFWKVR